MVEAKPGLPAVMNLTGGVSEGAQVPSSNSQSEWPEKKVRQSSEINSNPLEWRNTVPFSSVWVYSYSVCFRVTPSIVAVSPVSLSKPRMVVCSPLSLFSVKSNVSSPQASKSEKDAGSRGFGSITSLVPG